MIYESQMPHQIQQQSVGLESTYVIMQGVNFHPQQMPQNNTGLQRIVLASSSPQEKVNQVPHLVKFQGGRIVVLNQVRTTHQEYFR